MIDVLSAGGKQYIATAYYDQILKNKDALDVEVLDMIFENIVYDVGIVYGFEGLGNIHTTTLMTNKSTDIVSPSLTPSAMLSTPRSKRLSRSTANKP